MGIRVTLVILRLLRALYEHLDQPHYGLELSKQTGLSNGAMYPALDRLMAYGLVASEKEDIDEASLGRRNRRYFKLTADGIRFAEVELRSAPSLPNLSLPKGAH